MQPFRLFTASLALVLLLLAGCQDRQSTDSVTAPSEGESTSEAAEISPGNILESDARHAVYTLSNEAGGNRIIRYTRAGDGSLSAAGSFPTMGMGSGAGLGSQGSLVYQPNLLFAVNAGSNDVSVLAVTANGLSFVSKVPSGGTMPISLTVHGDELYVLNAGGAGNITGFRGARSGNLVMLPGSSRPLSGSGVAPAQVEFSPDGSVLVVTEKATNKIDTYAVGADGYATGPTVSPSAGQTPFGFAFVPHKNIAIISEAFGGAPGASALSSYLINGGASLITGPVATQQTAACWVVVTNNMKFAYTTNTGSNSISGYHVSKNGSLTRFNDGGVTGQTGMTPIDMALSNNSKYLYNLNAGSHSISIFKVNVSNGTLTSMGSVNGLPPSAVGLAAR